MKNWGLWRIAGGNWGFWAQHASKHGDWMACPSWTYRYSQHHMAVQLRLLPIACSQRLSKPVLPDLTLRESEPQRWDRTLFILQEQTLASCYMLHRAFGPNIITYHCFTLPFVVCFLHLLSVLSLFLGALGPLPGSPSFPLPRCLVPAIEFTLSH